MNTKPHSHRADAARRTRPKAKTAATNGAAHKSKGNGLATHAQGKSSTKSPKTRGKNATVHKLPRRIPAAPPSVPVADEKEKTIAFRLSTEESDLLDRRAKEGHEVSESLRSLLITHLLIGQERITSVTFIGGFRASKNRTNDKWTIVDKDNEVLHRDLDRDDAIIRCEWIAAESAEPTPTTRASETKAFRLSLEEHNALTRFKEINVTSFSAALRSFLTTQLVKGHERLMWVGFFNDYRAYPSRNGWCVGTGESGTTIKCAALARAGHPRRRPAVAGRQRHRCVCVVGSPRRVRHGEGRRAPGRRFRALRRHALAG